MADSSNVVWQVHLSLTWTEPEDPVTVKFIQSDHLVEAAAVNVHGSSITLKKTNKKRNFEKLLKEPVPLIMFKYSNIYFYFIKVAM